MARPPRSPPTRLLAVFAILVGADQQRPQCAPIEEGVDYFVDGDWGDNPAHATSAELCCEHCRRNPRCQSFTFVSKAAGKNSSSGCWLKGGLPMRKELKDGVVSGQVQAHLHIPAEAENVVLAHTKTTASEAPAAPQETKAPGGVQMVTDVVPPLEVPAAAPQEQCQPIEQNIRYMVESGWNETVDHIPDPQMCCMKCHKAEKCQAWTWIEDSGQDAELPSQCLLFGTAVQKKESKDGVVSGVLLQRGASQGSSNMADSASVSASEPAAMSDLDSPNYAGICQEATPCISGQFHCMEGISKGSCSPLKAPGFYDGAHGCKKFCGVGATSPAQAETGSKPHRNASMVPASFQGICYVPAPMKEPLRGAPGASFDGADLVASNTSAMWKVRGDLAIMQALGANTVRIFGSSGDVDHRPFLEEAASQGLGIITGFGEFPYYGLKYSCLRTNLDCSAQTKFLWYKYLKGGYLRSDRTYEPSVHTIVLMAEPDRRIQSILHEGPGNVQKLKDLFIKAAISALDGFLDAEAAFGVEGALPNLTVSFSYATCKVCSSLGDKPALGQMAELKAAMQSPEDYGYTAKNNLWAVYQARFVNSLVTDSSAEDFENFFLKDYGANFQGTPVFISEYHMGKLWKGKTDDLSRIMGLARNSSSLFAGIAFTQFQVRQDRGENQEFGLFELGSKELAQLTLGISTYTAWCLEPAFSDEAGRYLPQAVAEAFGGEFTGSEVGICPQTTTSTTTTVTTSTVTTSTRTTSTSTRTLTITNTTTTRTTTSSEPAGEMRGFLSFTSATTTKLQAENAVKSALALWYNIPEKQFIMLKVFESRRLQAVGEVEDERPGRRLAGSWMVSYTVLLHISEYDYVLKVATAISDNSKPFADTLQGELVEVGGDKVAVSSTFDIVSFTELEGERLTTPTTSTTTITSTLPWTALIGFLTIVVPDAGLKQVEDTVKTSLQMRLDLKGGEFYRISVFESGRRLQSREDPLMWENFDRGMIDNGMTDTSGMRFGSNHRMLLGGMGPSSDHQKGPVRWEVSYMLHVTDQYRQAVLDLGRVLSHDSHDFRSTLQQELINKGVSAQALDTSLKIVSFSKLQVDLTAGPSAEKGDEKDSATSRPPASTTSGSRIADQILN